MSELTAKENIRTAGTVKRITATAVMAAFDYFNDNFISFHISGRCEWRICTSG